MFSPTKWEPDSPLTMSRGWSPFLTLMHNSNTKSFLTELRWHPVRTPVEHLLHASHQARYWRKWVTSVMGFVPEQLSVGRKDSTLVPICVFVFTSRSVLLGCTVWSAGESLVPAGHSVHVSPLSLPQPRSWKPRSYQRARKEPAGSVTCFIF